MRPRRFPSSALPESAFIDTSGFYALLDGADAHHATAVRLFANLSTAGTRLVFTNFIRKVFSMTDATSFVVMERLGIRHALSFDRDFRQYGWTLLADV
jgi:predicted nucleic acid-binding protein